MIKIAILIFTVLSLLQLVNSWSIDYSRCQRNCNSDYDSCYSNKNADYKQCDQTHSSCMTGCEILGCKDDCSNTGNNCSINPRGYGCAGFNIFSCNSLCELKKWK
ncbi:hypothetical protein DICPUDRAFT_80784 [Dictyostelium purpureum]|uniref:Uncharacterized protein n=1 Tax=Dictyostelium purpureum TaxID=5786 RepID=F0ZRI8_DICPU|nr:uncharacterized protein DICPUDRAFT_80784 [Dictyostelium purpureum]EGC33461.1 hypothetical protein DICPUDRAFT_80784 [Dictyostelium purpureum]|eukprot:XP_003290032.1 hypothetical protein DICPUDRAFT_80784 [Dictyostelium purpureum]